MKVTLKKLKDLDACDEAVDLVKSLLPLKLFADVDKNTETAITLINHYSIKKVRPRCRCPKCSKKGRIGRGADQ